MFRKKMFMILGVLMLVSGGSVEAQVLWLETGHHVWTDDSPYYSEVFLRNDVTFDFLGGSISKLSTLDNSVLNLDGGEMTSLWITGNSVVHYHSGEFDYIAADHSSVLLLYAYDVTYDPLGGMDERGYVEGFLYNNHEPFGFSCQNVPTWEHIEIVPEPGTLALISLGALVIRKWK